ncbi:MAG: ABC-F family ATP-binding cassette domain-containing protein [Actinobacteria bacterium]|nr:ABC-F family ATP-binding cassette domain-containing protein [Actinomycetota bacterium]
MGHIDVQHVTYALPDGRVLLDDVSFRVGEGAKAALIGANGAGKTTLLRMIAGDLQPDDGSVITTGGLGVMRQFIGHGTDGTVRDLLLSVSSEDLQRAAADVDDCEIRLMDSEDPDLQMRYAQALADYADAGGYDAEVAWDVCCTSALGLAYDDVKWRPVSTLSGGEQKRLVLEALLRGSDEVLVLDEPDNYLDVPAKQWLEQSIAATSKTILLVSHDRELLRACASTIVTVELGAAGNIVWVHGGGFATYAEARADRMSRLEELRRRWDEQHQKLKDLVEMLKTKATYNDGLASRYQAAQTRLRKFEEAGPPQAVPIRQSMRMRLQGGRTAKRAVICEGLQLTDLTEPFDLEVWYGERLAVLGRNGAGKSHLLRLLAAGGTDPDVEHQPVNDLPIAPVRHVGTARLGSRVRPGWFAQTHVRPDLKGRTLLEILHRGDGHRAGMGREQAARALDRYGLAGASEQSFDSLSGGQQARVQILLLELSGATLLLLDEPTDNLDLESAEALEAALDAFDGTVVAVTHDRWFARDFDRYLVVGAEGAVRESDEPVWRA